MPWDAFPTASPSRHRAGALFSSPAELMGTSGACLRLLRLVSLARYCCHTGSSRLTSYFLGCFASPFMLPNTEQPNNKTISCIFHHLALVLLPGACSSLCCHLWRQRTDAAVRRQKSKEMNSVIRHSGYMAGATGHHAHTTGWVMT